MSESFATTSRDQRVDLVGPMATSSVERAQLEKWRPRRRRPRLREILPMFDLAVRRPRRSRALKWCGDAYDVRALARRRVPRMVFDFVDGAAGSESSLTRAREMFGRVEFEPQLLQDVSKVDLRTTILGSESALPFYFAPTGATRLMHHAGEAAVAQVASDLGIPYCLSSSARPPSRILPLVPLVPGGGSSSI